MLKSITPYILSLSVLIWAHAVSAADPTPKGKLAASVAGKLVKAEGRKVNNFAIKANPKYYVLYHSASW